MGLAFLAEEPFLFLNNDLSRSGFGGISSKFLTCYKCLLSASGSIAVV